MEYFIVILFLIMNYMYYMYYLFNKSVFTVVILNHSLCYILIELGQASKIFWIIFVSNLIY